MWYPVNVLFIQENSWKKNELILIMNKNSKNKLNYINVGPCYNDLRLKLNNCKSLWWKMNNNNNNDYQTK